MFNKELFEISKEKVKNINEEYLHWSIKDYEKTVLETIKKFAKEGFGTNGSIIILRPDENINVFHTFMNIIYQGMLKYFEDEYCLYLVNNKANSVRNRKLEFIWNAKEYYIKNMGTNAKKESFSIGK